MTALRHHAIHCQYSMAYYCLHDVQYESFFQAAITYSSMDALLSVSYNLPEGTLAYVMDQELLYLRVKNGLKIVMVSSTLVTDNPSLFPLSMVT